MMVNVGFDLLLGYSADCAAKIAPRPQMLAPVSLFQQREFILQFPRRYSLDELGDLRWTEIGRRRHHQMHMVTTDVALQDGDFSAGTDLADNVACPFRRFSPQHLVAIFRHPHEVILNVVDRMRSLPILRHDGSPPIVSGILRSFLAEAVRLKAKV